MTIIVRESGGAYDNLAEALDNASFGELISIEGFWNSADNSPAVFGIDCDVVVSGDAKHPGYIDAGLNHYRLVVSNGAHCLELNGAFSTTIDGIVIQQASTTSSAEGFRCAPSTSDSVTLGNSIIECTTNTASQDCFYLGSGAVGSITVEQCMIMRAGRGGIRSGQDATDNLELFVNSCTIWDCGRDNNTEGGGITSAATTSPNANINVHNCIVVGNTSGNAGCQDFNLTSTGSPNTWNVSYSIDSDGSIATDTDGGTGNLANRTAISGTPVAGDWVIFERITGSTPFDLRLSDEPENDAQDMHLATQPDTDTGLTIPPIDIVGTTRPQNTNFDCGPFEIFAVTTADGEGSSVGVATATGAGAARTGTVGSSSGVATVMGALSVGSVAEGSASGAATVMGALSVGSVAEGSASGAATVTGAGLSKISAEGTIAGIATASATSRLLGTASSSGVATVQGFGGGPNNGDGTSAGSATAAAESVVKISRAGTSAGIGVSTGILRAVGAFAGSSAGLASGTALSAPKAAAEGSSAAAAISTGLARAIAILTGSSVGSSITVGFSTSLTSGIGSSAGSSTAQAESFVAGASQGSSSGSSITVGFSSPITSGIGSSAGVATAPGSLVAISEGEGATAGFLTGDFDGIDDLVLTSAPIQATSGTDPVSFEWWSNFNMLGSVVTVFGRDGSEQTSQIRVDENVVVLHLGGFTDGVNRAEVEHFLPPNSGWHHFVVTWDGSAVRLYVDGSPSVDGPQTMSAPEQWDSTLLIGASRTIGNVNPLEDSIALVRTYSDELTAAEAKDAYKNGATFGNLITKYDFTDQEGITLTDSSGNGNDGTLVDATNAWWGTAKRPSGFAASVEGVGLATAFTEGSSAGQSLGVGFSTSLTLGIAQSSGSAFGEAFATLDIVSVGSAAGTSTAIGIPSVIPSSGITLQDPVLSSGETESSIASATADASLITY